MQNNKKIFKASLLVVVSGILYGFLGFLGTEVLREGIPVTAMLFWRFIVAGIWIFPFIIFKNSRQSISTPMSKQAFMFMLSIGALGYAGSALFYFMSSHYVGTGVAMVIFFSYPLVIALLSWLMHGKQISYITISALMAMAVGLYLLRYSPTQHVNILGILFGVMAAICYAIYVLGSKRVTSMTMDCNKLTMVICFSCALVFLALSIGTHTLVWPHSLKTWLYVFALGVFATALPIQLMLEGLKYISSMRASIISVLEPLVTVLVGVFLLYESISGVQVLGGMIVLMSALLIQLKKEL